MNDFSISLSDKKHGVMAVLGHAGIGHVHSHSSFVQDDSAGFAVVATLMKLALNTDTRIKSVSADSQTGYITIETNGGGRGKSFSRRGLTPYEIELLDRAVGEDGIYTQAVAVKTFGRMYGQGVMETPVALQGAIALAVMDTFYKKAPDKVHITSQKYEGLIDKMAGTVVDINDIPISLLLNTNGSEGGIGPDEDNEGNTDIGDKANIMKSLGMFVIPNIIVESKAYIPDESNNITKNTFLFRSQEGIDNMAVAKVLANAASQYNIPYILKTNSMPMVAGNLKKATINFAEKIVQLGEDLKKADTSKDKVSIIASIAKLVSEDAGGISFMSNELNDVARSAGIMPNTASVISMIVPKDYINYWKIPVLNSQDVNQYIKIIVGSIPST